MTIRERGAAKLLFLSLSCLWPLPAFAQEVVNPSGFNFTITSAEVSRGPSLCLSPEGDLGMSAAPSGAKLVKVILKGQVSRSGRLILIASAFTAIYERAGQKRRDVVLASAM